MKTFRFIACSFACMTAVSVVNSQTRVKLAPFATGLLFPVGIYNAGDSRLFVVEREGYITIINPSGKVNTVPFLDIHNRVKSTDGEQGLLGLTFHPKYSTNGFFYVDYTGIGDSLHISRFCVSQSNPDIADTLSEVKILTIYKPYENHNAGDIKFGPDGYLYIGTGDGGSEGDPGNRAQDSSLLLGKILRIDINCAGTYVIPPSNPFYNTPGARGEIWALGLRNPWRFSFDRFTGDLWIADVGSSRYEEIDFQSVTSKGGENYGWRCYEADSVFNTTGCRVRDDYVFPVYFYTHSIGCAVIGGYVYRGTRLPEFNGHYFFSDYCSDHIWALYDSLGTQVVMDQGQFSGNNFSSLGEDAKGEIYIAGLTSGIIYSIEDSVTGLNNLADNTDKIKIYPILTYNKIIVEIQENTLLDNYIIYLYNIQGQLLIQQKVKIDKTELDLTPFAEGIYVVKLIANNFAVERKIVRE